jgi:hypothetical protein
MMTNLNTEVNINMVYTDNTVSPNNSLSTTVENAEVKDDLSRPTRKRFTKKYPFKPKSAIQNMQNSKLNSKRKSKLKFPSSPANYKRKITGIIKSLENFTLETPINSPTKKELIDHFETINMQIMDKLTEMIKHLEIMRSYDEAFNRRERQKLYRQQKIERANPIHVEIPVINETLSKTLNESLIDVSNINTILGVTLEDINIDCFNEFESNSLSG